MGLGSNLGDPAAQVKHAVEALGAVPATRLVACSRLYRSRPMGPQDQPDYVNAVARLVTTLSPHALLDALQQIESARGRVRGPERWGPRTLDLDLLLYGEEVIGDARLTVPHAGLKERSFVLYPLFDIAPELILPDGTELKELLACCPRDGLTPAAP